LGCEARQTMHVAIVTASRRPVVLKVLHLASTIDDNRPALAGG
jgi:hypothetical protein